MIFKPRQITMSENQSRIMGVVGMIGVIIMQFWMSRVKGTSEKGISVENPFLESIKNIEIFVEEDHWSKFVPDVVNSRHGVLQMQCINCINCGNYAHEINLGAPNTNSPAFELNEWSATNAWCFCHGCDPVTIGCNYDDDHEYEYYYEREDYYDP